MAPRTPRKNAAGKRKISRQMLGPQGWGLERLLAIYAALFRYDADSDDGLHDGEEGLGERRRKRRGKGAGGGGGGEILTQFATLVGMRLLVRAGAAGGGGDPLEAGGGKWKVNVGGTYVRQVARGLRFDLDSYILA